MVFCAAFGCNNSSNYKRAGASNTKTRFFRFPKDPTIFKRWIINIRRKDLDGYGPGDSRCKYLKLCGTHFEDIMFNCPTDVTNSRLLPTAVPTLVMVKNPPPQLGCKRTTANSSKPSFEPSKKRRRIESPVQQVPVSPSFSTDPVPSTDSAPRKMTTNCRRKLCDLRSVIAKKSCQIRKLKAQKDVYKRLYEAEKDKKTCSLCDGCKSLSPAQQAFFSSQVIASSKKPRGRRWSSNDREFSLALYFKSPAAYHIVASQFMVPTVKTLIKPMQNIMSKPGICPVLIDALRVKATTMKPIERNAVLTFDAMNISQAVRYLEDRDEVIGFVDYGDGQKNSTPASLMFAVMLRGVSTKWKQPIAFILASSGLTPEFIYSLVIQAVSRVHNVGINVVTVVCDLETQQSKCIRDFFCISPSQPFFQHPITTEKVHVMFDPPHLLKCIRNNLRNYDILFPDGTRASWQHIQQMMQLEFSRVLRLAPKLKPVHLLLPVGKKMRVCLAAQVLSHSVSTALEFYVSEGQLPSDAKVTASFIERINFLWDLMNSASLKQTGQKAPIKKGFLNERLKEIKELQEWVSAWKFEDQREGAKVKIRTTLPFKSALVMTLASMRSLLKHLIEDKGFDYVCTRRFNQDIVENLFCQVRHDKGGFNEHPEAGKAIQSLKAISCSMFLAPVGKKQGNCEDDGDNLLISLTNSSKSIATKKKLAFPITHSTAPHGSTSTAVRSTRVAKIDGIKSLWSTASKAPSIPPSLPNSEKEVCGYVAGYIIMKWKRKLDTSTSCSSCTTYFETASLNFFQGLKNFSYAQRGLQAAPENLISALTKCEVISRRFLLRNLHKPGPMMWLCNSIYRNVSFDFLPLCHKTELREFIVKMYLRIRIHFSCSQMTTQIRDIAREKRRKRKKLGVL